MVIERADGIETLLVASDFSIQLVQTVEESRERY